MIDRKTSVTGGYINLFLKRYNISGISLLIGKNGIQINILVRFCWINHLAPPEIII